MVHGASRSSKIQQDTWPSGWHAGGFAAPSATLVITIKTRISFKEHIKSGTNLLATGPKGVEGIFVREFMLLLDRSKPVDEDIFSATAVT